MLLILMSTFKQVSSISCTVKLRSVIRNQIKILLIYRRTVKQQNSHNHLISFQRRDEKMLRKHFGRSKADFAELKIVYGWA